MKRKIFSVLTALSAAILITSTVFAGAIKLSRVTFSLGSLVANGKITGLGNQDVIVHLDASGFPLVTCTNQGGNQAPGQNPPKVSAGGQQALLGDDPSKTFGKYLFGVETENPTELDAVEYGCPNDNWTASIDFVFWDEATISIKDLDGNELLTQDYTCTTTLTNVSCTPVK